MRPDDTTPTRDEVEAIRALTLPRYLKAGSAVSPEWVARCRTLLAYIDALELDGEKCGC